MSLCTPPRHAAAAGCKATSGMGSEPLQDSPKPLGRAECDAPYLSGRIPCSFASCPPRGRAARAPSTPVLPAHSLPRRSIPTQTALSLFAPRPGGRTKLLK